MDDGCKPPKSFACKRLGVNRESYSLLDSMPDTRLITYLTEWYGITSFSIGISMKWDFYMNLWNNTEKLVLPRYRKHHSRVYPLRTSMTKPEAASRSSCSRSPSDCGGGASGLVIEEGAKPNIKLSLQKKSSDAPALIYSSSQFCWILEAL